MFLCNVELSIPQVDMLLIRSLFERPHLTRYPLHGVLASNGAYLFPTTGLVARSYAPADADDFRNAKRPSFQMEPLTWAITPCFLGKPSSSTLHATTMIVDHDAARSRSPMEDTDSKKSPLLAPDADIPVSKPNPRRMKPGAGGGSAGGQRRAFGGGQSLF